MRFEPPIARTRLVEILQSAYELPAIELTFVPVGFDAACYTLDLAGGGRYFLKVWPRLGPTTAPSSRQIAALSLTRAIHERGVGPHVPYPVPRRDGALWSNLDGVPFAVFPFLPGTTAPEPLPALLAGEFGRTVAAIHRATSVLADVLPPRETFDVSSLTSEIEQWLTRTTTLGQGERPGLVALCKLLLSHEDEIRAQIARLRRLVEVVRTLDGQFVLCHGDLGGDNMLVDDDGRLAILDWDYPAVAPPEHDLWSALGPSFAGVLTAYRDAGGVSQLHVDHFAFYLLRRSLGDMAARIDRILAGTSPAEDDANLLEGIQLWGINRWRELDATLAAIQSVVAAKAG